MMSPADRYLAAVADDYNRARDAATTPEAQLPPALKMIVAPETMGNAVEPNPVSGLMGMAVMATLARQIAETPG